jgi:hypothetical protein
VALSATLVLAACGSSEPQKEGSDDAFYAGKTIELIVPFGPGGGVDSTARFLAPMLQDLIEGNPEVQVVNIEGVAGILGYNDFAARPADGLTLLQSTATGHFFDLFGSPDYEGDLSQWIPLATAAQGTVFYVSPETGIESAEDLLDSEVPLILPSRSPEGGELRDLLTLELLGVEFEAIFGYEDSGATRLAFEQGEANIMRDNTASYMNQVVPLVDQGTAIPLFTSGQVEDGELIRDPNLPDLPHVGEVYEMLHGKAPSGEMLDAYILMSQAGGPFNKVTFVHADAPEEALEALRAAVSKLAKHPDYEAGVEDIMGGYEVEGGPEIEESFADVFGDPPKDLVDWIVNWANESYGADLRVSG